MCGIAGFINLKGGQNIEFSGALEDAAQALNLRGPDRQSTYHPKPGLGFAHARLSIIDTSNPSLFNSRAKLCPIKPEPPIILIFFIIFI